MLGEYITYVNPRLIMFQMLGRGILYPELLSTRHVCEFYLLTHDSQLFLM